MYVQAEGSRISSTVGRKIRYRFPSSKLSTRYVWEGRQETPYGQRGTQPASLAYVSYVGWKLWAQPCLNRLARLYDVCTRDRSAIHTPGTGTGTETGSKTCGHLETREREFDFESSSMWDDARARSLI